MDSFPPLSSTVEVSFGAQSRRGDGRAINEDHYSVIRLGRHQETLLTSLPAEKLPAPFHEYGHVMVVADGLGDGGADSPGSLAIATLKQLMLHFGRWNLRVDEEIATDILDRAKRFYRYIDAVIAERSRSTQASHQTTLTAVFGAGHDLFFAHVGHSRAYLFRDNTLMRLTRDHTLGTTRPLPIAPLVDVSAAARDATHILTGAIGGRGTAGPAIDLDRFQILDGDRILLCTNGLTDAIDDDTIRAALASDHSPEVQCRILIDAAGAAGTQDDATALIAHFLIPE